MSGMRIAIVGLGSAGTSALESLSSDERYSIVGLVDSDETVLSWAAPALSECSFRSCDEMLERVVPDILYVATTSPSHCEIVLRAVELGVKSILCEKPIATSIDEARLMVESCRENAVRLAVNHTRRWHPVFQRAAQFLAAGSMGPVAHVHTTLGGGRLGCMGSHVFDTWRMLLNDDVEWISACIDERYAGDHKGRDLFDPGGHAFAVFKKGTRASLDISEDMGTPPFHVITCAMGRMLIDESEGVTMECHARSDSGMSKRLGEYDLPLHSVYHMCHGGSFDTLECALEELAGARDISCTGLDGFKSLQMCLMCHQSSHNGTARAWAALPQRGLRLKFA